MSALNVVQPPKISFICVTDDVSHGPMPALKTLHSWNMPLIVITADLYNDV